MSARKGLVCAFSLYFCGENTNLLNNEKESFINNEKELYEERENLLNEMQQIRKEYMMKIYIFEKVVEEQRLLVNIRNLQKKKMVLNKML